MKDAQNCEANAMADIIVLDDEENTELDKELDENTCSFCFQTFENPSKLKLSNIYFAFYVYKNT